MGVGSLAAAADPSALSPEALDESIAALGRERDRDRNRNRNRNWKQNRNQNQNRNRNHHTTNPEHAHPD